MALRPLLLLPLAALFAATALADNFDAQVAAGLRLVGERDRHDHDRRGGDRRGDHERGRDDRRLERERRERWRDYDRPKPPAPVQPSPREYEPREPRNREIPRAPEPSRPRLGRWHQGYGNTVHVWRPTHFTLYLGYSNDIEECIQYGREANFPYVTRYDFSGDCYGDTRPY